MFRTLLSVFAFAVLLPGLAWATPTDQCAASENKVSASHYRCMAKASQLEGAHRDRRESRCTNHLERNARRADRRGDCEISSDTSQIATAVDGFSQAIINAANGTADFPEITVTPECDLETVNLLDYDAWDRENGYWIGEYTFLGADGDPNQSSSWPYRYDHYRGFIHLAVEGNAIAQRNIFLYPPQDSSLCTGDPSEVKGNGTCGVNGNEKVYSADQSASDCKGSLAGNFSTIYGDADTFTTIVEPDRVLYQVTFSTPPFDGNLMSSHLTTLPGNGTRVRTAQGFNVATELASYASFYRETKVSEAEFWEQLEATRIEYNILPEDECGWDGVTSGPSGISCAEHFGN